MGHRHRWWYRLTGLPGWMRFGFSPGWVGRSPFEPGPYAQYLMSGQWPTPQMDYYWQGGQTPFSPPPGSFMPGFPAPGYPPLNEPWGTTQLTPNQELDMLKGQAELLEDELDAIAARIKELEGGKK